MSNVAAAIARLHWRSLVAMHGEKVQYLRGDLVINLTAVASKPKAMQFVAGQAITISSSQMDWLVDPDELVDGQRIEPKRGDKIERANGQKYRVSPASGSDDVWRWSDGNCTWRRVLTEEL